MPFLYVASFYFLLVFICMNLLVCCILDNFSVLASMDADHFEPEELEEFGEVWHQLTFKRIVDVDPQEIGIDITDHIADSLTEESLAHLRREAAASR